MSSKARILIVDDSPQDIHMLIGELNDTYIITASTSADDGIAALRVEDKKPDLILLDVNMPGKDGYEACREIKNDPGLKDIDVIFLSANDTTEEIIKGLDLGAVDYIVKPYEPAILRSKIKNALESVTRKANLQQQAEAANQLIYTVMSESGNLSGIINFMRMSFEASTSSELMKITLDALRQTNLNAVVLFEQDTVSELGSTGADPNMLEVELLSRMKGHDKPFFEHGARLFVVQKSIVVLIKNMPEDNEKRGSLKDHLMILLEGANAKLKFFVELSAAAGKKYSAICQAVVNAKNALDSIHIKQEAHKKHTVEILDQMVEEVEASFLPMALTDAQESQLLDILSAAVDRSLAHMESGFKIDDEVKDIVKKLSIAARDAAIN